MSDVRSIPVPARDDREKLNRADSADAILSHPLIAEALDSFEQEVTKAWQSSKAKDQQGREELYRLLQASGHFRAYLQQVAMTGKLIRYEAQRQQTLMERAHNLLRGRRR